MGLQQNDLAAALRITQSAYSRLESGDIVLSLTQLRIAAAVFQTPASAILDSADQYANFLQMQGVQITDEKKDNSAAVLIGLGLLAAVMALGASSQ